jgi:EAL domain-containing protein (putative c-di-GMP-specific phosphodiesterase class I)
MNATASEWLMLESHLRRALERDELVLHYQPQIDLRTGKIVGAEALIRWKHPEWGMVSPAKFIPLAEETGLIVPISEWVLRSACAQNVAWQQMGLPPIRVAVNLSGRHLSKHAELVKQVANTLEATGLAPELLELELTESILMEDVEAAIETLEQLSAMGVKLSIDDFGTGYSSLSYLKRFPIDTLKIDQAFVREIATAEEDAAIVIAVIALAHSLRLNVIAEGVETDGQLGFLKHQGCDEVQGYFFSRPLPVADLVPFLRDHQPQSVQNLLLR